MKTKTKALALVGAVALLAAESIGIAAEAGNLRVRCERRGNERSRVSVDGRDVAPGAYLIQLTSGGNTAPQVTKTVVAPADEFRRTMIATEPTYWPELRRSQQLLFRTAA
jgi:hypothetical protein